MQNKNIIKQLIAVACLVAGVYLGYQLYSYYSQPTKPTRVTTRTSRPVAKKALYPNKITGKVITLRKLKLQHAYDYYTMFSPTVRKSLEFPEKVTFSYVEYHIREYVKGIKNNKLIAYGIWDNQDNKLIGSIKIMHKDYVDLPDWGQLSMWLNENYWGGGRIQEALVLISRAYFKAHPKEEFYIANVREWNKRSQRAMEKFGFVRIEDRVKDGKLWSYRYKLSRSNPRL